MYELLARGPQNKLEELRIELYERSTRWASAPRPGRPDHGAGRQDQHLPDPRAPSRGHDPELRRHPSRPLRAGRLGPGAPGPSLAVRVAGSALGAGLQQVQAGDLNTLTREEVASWKPGQTLLLSGKMLTGRDAAHKRIQDMLAKGEQLPVDFTNRVIYYVGPVDPVRDEVVGPAGPTTATRMDKFTEMMLAQTGLISMIGKSERGPVAIEAIRKHGSAYLMAVGGAAYLVSKAIREARVLAFEDLGMEAIYEFDVKDMPVTVAVDAQGISVHNTGPKEWQARSARSRSRWPDPSWIPHGPASGAVCVTRSRMASCRAGIFIHGLRRANRDRARAAHHATPASSLRSVAWSARASAACEAAISSTDLPSTSRSTSRCLAQQRRAAVATGVSEKRSGLAVTAATPPAGCGSRRSCRATACGCAKAWAMSLNHEVVAGPRGVGTVLAEAGDRAIDEARIQRLQAGVVQPVLGAHLKFSTRMSLAVASSRISARPRALPYRLDRALVAVGAQVIGRFLGVAARPSFRKRAVPRRACRRRRLGARSDHVRAQVGKVLGAPGGVMHRTPQVAGRRGGLGRVVLDVEAVDGMPRPPGCRGSCWLPARPPAEATPLVPVARAAGVDVVAQHVASGRLLSISWVGAHHG